MQRHAKGIEFAQVEFKTALFDSVRVNIICVHKEMLSV